MKFPKSEIITNLCNDKIYINHKAMACMKAILSFIAYNAIFAVLSMWIKLGRESLLGSKVTCLTLNMCPTQQWPGTLPVI